MLRVGLTGGIGSGKSAAAKMFENLGVPIVDADIVSREVVEPGEPALDQIIEHYGKGILLESGHLDRKQLREIIFTSSQEKTWLEKLLHPLINKKVEALLSCQTAAYVILVSPLLLETTQHQLVDRILVIRCEPDLQLSRVLMRDNTDSKTTQAIIRSQVNGKERQQKADDIIDNNGTLSDLLHQVHQLHGFYLQLATRHQA